LLPGNAERNLARIYAQTKHVLDGLTNIEFTTDLRSTLIKNRVKYADLLEQGDMLVVPTFQPTVTIDAASYPKTKKDVLNMIKNNQMALYDAYFDLNQGPTDLEAWEKAASPYVVKNYVMQYEPIVIQSKTVQPWCSERFVDRRSACLLESYFGGNDFIVLDHDFAIHKESNAKQRVSDLDVGVMRLSFYIYCDKLTLYFWQSVIEKRLYAKFYWEQCVYQGRQLDALDLWNSKKSEHIREQCSRVIQNWGRGLIGKPE
jgi:hypothetical protein